MKNLRTTATILLQLIIVGPMHVYFPFALIVGIGMMFSGFEVRDNELPKAISFALGWLGLIGLYSSIFFPIRYIRQTPLLKWGISVLLLLGYIATCMFFIGEGAITIGTNNDLFVLWCLGGPVFVATWNLIKIHKPAENDDL